MRRLGGGGPGGHQPIWGTLSSRCVPGKAWGTDDNHQTRARRQAPSDRAGHARVQPVDEVHTRHNGRSHAIGDARDRSRSPWPRRPAACARFRSQGPRPLPKPGHEWGSFRVCGARASVDRAAMTVRSRCGQGAGVVIAVLESCACDQRHLDEPSPASPERDDVEPPSDRRCGHVPRGTRESSGCHLARVPTTMADDDRFEESITLARSHR